MHRFKNPSSTFDVSDIHATLKTFKRVRTSKISPDWFHFYSRDKEHVYLEIGAIIKMTSWKQMAFLDLVHVYLPLRKTEIS